MDDSRMDGVCEGRFCCGGKRIAVDSGQIYSWHFDTRDGELVAETPARRLNYYHSLGTGDRGGDLYVGGDEIRRRG